MQDLDLLKWEISESPWNSSEFSYVQLWGIPVLQYQYFLQVLLGLFTQYHDHLLTAAWNWLTTNYEIAPDEVVPAGLFICICRSMPSSSLGFLGSGRGPEWEAPSQLQLSSVAPCLLPVSRLLVKILCRTHSRAINLAWTAFKRKDELESRSL